MTVSYEDAVRRSERMLDEAWVDSRGEAIVAISVADLRALLAGPPEQPCRECDAVSGAIGGVEFMDPPDGGDVSLSEQVRRMRAKIDAGPPEPSEEEVARVIEFEAECPKARALEVARRVQQLFRSRRNG